MFSAPWRILLILLVVMAGCFGLQGGVADTPPGVLPDSPAPVDPLPVPTASPTVKATIAPIHTKEPVIKPPVDQPTGSPSPSPGSDPTQVRTSPATTIPTTVPVTPGPTPGDSNESALEAFRAGLAYEKAGDYLAAISEYDRAIAREPYYADAWYHKALSFEQLDRWDDAYQAYRFLLTIDPGFAAQRDLTGDPAGNTSGPLPPPDLGMVPGTPLLWIAAGALLALGGGAGAVLYLRRLRVPGGENGAFRKGLAETGQFPDVESIGKIAGPYYQGDSGVLMAVLRLAVEIAREGREGKPVGTAFIVGDSEAVLARSRQLILNPLAGHCEEERLITNPDMRENVKELSQVDGAFVITESGVVEAAGRYVSIDTSRVRLPKGFGTRHVSVAAITQETKAVGIVVSESGGMVRVFAKGKVIAETM